jgi:hypothetical protein
MRHFIRILRQKYSKDSVGSFSLLRYLSDVHLAVLGKDQDSLEVPCKCRAKKVIQGSGFGASVNSKCAAHVIFTRDFHT